MTPDHEFLDDNLSDLKKAHDVSRQPSVTPVEHSSMNVISQQEYYSKLYEKNNSMDSTLDHNFDMAMAYKDLSSKAFDKMLPDLEYTRLLDVSRQASFSRIFEDNIEENVTSSVSSQLAKQESKRKSTKNQESILQESLKKREGFAMNDGKDPVEKIDSRCSSQDLNKNIFNSNSNETNDTIHEKKRQSTVSEINMNNHLENSYSQHVASQTRCKNAISETKSANYIGLQSLKYNAVNLTQPSQAVLFPSTMQRDDQTFPHKNSNMHLNQSVPMIPMQSNMNSFFHVKSASNLLNAYENVHFSKQFENAYEANMAHDYFHHSSQKNKMRAWNSISNGGHGEFQSIDPVSQAEKQIHSSGNVTEDFSNIENSHEDEGKPGRKKRRGRPKRDPREGWPKRPLSAYNIFFKCEREKLLKAIQSNPEFQPKKQKRSASRRKRPKTHGIISFTNLAKTIGSRWQLLSQEEKNPYELKALLNKEKYKMEVKQFTESLKEKKDQSS